jgi:hypothetical protein
MDSSKERRSRRCDVEKISDQKFKKCYMYDETVGKQLNEGLSLKWQRLHYT